MIAQLRENIYLLSEALEPMILKEDSSNANDEEEFRLNQMIREEENNIKKLQR